MSAIQTDTQKRWRKLQNNAREIRARRLKKIAIAQDEIEEQLLSLRAMYGSDTEMWKKTNSAFAQLYYLVRLSKN